MGGAEHLPLPGFEDGLSAETTATGVGSARGNHETPALILWAQIHVH